VLKGMADVGSLFSSLTASGDMFGISHLIHRGDLWDVLPWLAIFTGVALIAKNSDEWVQSLRPSFRWALAALILLLLGMPDVQQPSEFLYFNF